MDYLIDPILPKYEVHIIAGPSGAGKTTWLFQQLNEWRRGLPVLNFPSSPVPFVYVSCDRSYQSMEATIRRIGMDKISALSVIDEELEGINPIIARAKELEPSLGLLILDGAATLVTDGRLENYGKVSGFLRRLTKYCQVNQITIILIVHSPKAKEGERFAAPRERIMGSAAWAGFADTVFLVEPVNSSDPEDMGRYVYVLPRNAAEFREEYTLDMRGRFTNSDTRSIMDEFLSSHRPGTELRVGQFLEHATSHQLSRATVYRWIETKVRTMELVSKTRGKYQIPVAH